VRTTSRWNVLSMWRRRCVRTNDRRRWSGEQEWRTRARRLPARGVIDQHGRGRSVSRGLNRHGRGRSVWRGLNRHGRGRSAWRGLNRHGRLSVSPTADVSTSLRARRLLVALRPRGLRTRFFVSLVLGRRTFRCRVRRRS